jgi:DNA-directed RNA polymerase subunit RPC12/RpoP
MNTPKLVTCPCQNCNGHIQFDAVTLSKDNDRIACPHCGLETILFVPPPTNAKIKPILSGAPPPSPRRRPSWRRTLSRSALLLTIILAPILALFAYAQWKSAQWSAKYDAMRLRHGLMMTNAVLQGATNAVPGITAIVEILLADSDPNISNWWATVEVDYIPPLGGMARTNIPLKFIGYATHSDVVAGLVYEDVVAVLDYEKLEKDEARREKF